MTALPYSKRLLELRRTGVVPWAVVVEIGSGAARIRHDLPRVWVPDDFSLGEADMHALVGLDLLVTGSGDQERAQAVLSALWQRARPATLWWVCDGCATRLQPHAGFRGEELVEWTPRRVPLYALEDLQAAVRSARETAELLGEGIFSGQAFVRYRADLARRMGCSPDTVRLLTAGAVPMAA